MSTKLKHILYRENMTRTKDEIEEIVKNRDYILLKEYIETNKHRRIVIQDRFGYKYDIELNSFIRGYIPRIVDKANPYSLENIILWLQLNKSEFLLCKDNNYINAKTNLKFYHTLKECKENFYMTWDNICHGQNCPFCCGQSVSNRNRLSILYPEISYQWHPTKNGNLTPFDVSYGSGKKVWWLCPNEHEYYSSICGRTIENKGCKLCTDKQKESPLATGLKEYFIKYYNAEKEYKILKNSETNSYLPYDIYIPFGNNSELNGYYIEVHGGQHYKITGWVYKHAKRKNISAKEEFKYQKNLDKIKKNFANKNGKYIEIDIRKIKTIEEAIKYIEYFLPLDKNKKLCYSNI